MRERIRAASLQCGRTVTVHFPPERRNGTVQNNGIPKSVNPGGDVGDPEPAEYTRPDIVILGSMRNASIAIKSVLAVIGDEQDYHGSLMVLRTQALRIRDFADELLKRYAARGVE